MGSISVSIINNHNLIHYKVIGEIDEKDLVEAYMKAVFSPDYRPDMNRFWDFRKSRTNLNIDINEVVRKIAENAAPGVSYINCLLVKDTFDYGMARMYQTLSSDLPVKIVITRNPVEACELLGLEYDPDRDEPAVL